MVSLIVFGWHNVDATWCFPSTGREGRDGLERQLRFLSRAAHVVPLQGALDALRGGGRLPPRAVALSFDDGYRDNLELAVPMLERLGLPATFFLVPALLDGGEAWWERLARAFATGTRPQVEWEGARLELPDAVARKRVGDATAEQLKRRDRLARAAAVDELVGLLAPGETGPERLFLDWTEAAELARRGFDLGSHSSRHVILSQESAQAQHEDLALARTRLAALGRVVDVLAYPNGSASDYSPATIEAARSAGHTFAVTTRGGVNRRATPPYEVHRYGMYPEQGTTAFLKIVKYAGLALRSRAAGRLPVSGRSTS